MSIDFKGRVAIVTGAGGGLGKQHALALAARGGVDVRIEGVTGLISGYVVERPMRLRDALEPLSLAYGFDGAERHGQVTVIAREGQPGGGRRRRRSS